LFAIQREKKNQDYVKYLDAMFNYLHNYMERVKPLIDLQTQMDEASAEFEKKWNEGTFQGWPVSYC
jgi:splicing factor 3A subunit 3